MRKLLILMPIAACLVALPGCSAAVAGTPAPSSTPAPMTLAPGASSAHIVFTKDPRDVAKNRTFDFAGDAASTCHVASGQYGIDVGISDDAAAEGTMSAISVQTGREVTPGGGHGRAVTQTNFNAQVGGTDYDSSYQTDDGKAGHATTEAVLGPDGVLTVDFEATSWDGAEYHGTIRCRPTSG